MIVKGRPFEILLHLCHYFERNIENSKLFKPEFLAAESIKTLIQSRTALSEQDVNQIIQIVRETDCSEHYDGSGWFDYKNHLIVFLKNNGYDIRGYIGNGASK